jgi:Cu-Zn family superoxide dismutase
MQPFVRHANRSAQGIIISSMLAGLMFCLGCERTSAEESTQKAAEGESAEETKEVVRAVAKMKPTDGSAVSGVVYFESAGDGVMVRATLMGLEPGSVHGFHIHEKGDCSAPDATSAGGHYAPEGNRHGLPPSKDRHAGDMGNIVSDEEGTAKIERTFDTFSLEGGTSVVGRAVIVHAEEDQGTQPTGEAGARLACGVIEINAEGVVERHTKLDEE